MAAHQAVPPAPLVISRPLPQLLNDVREILCRYVSFQFPEQPTAVTLWIAHTWVLDAFDYTPYLHIYSAETSSGKSRLLEVLALLVNKPWKVESVSVAALFRRIEKDRPTLFYDEIENVFRAYGKDDDTKDLRACLNSGFKRDGKFSRCVGQHANLDVKEFATFSPKGLAGIGKVLSDTLSNRCIPVELLPQMREQKAEKFREREVRPQFDELRAELQTWAQLSGLIDELRKARPSLPNELTDRQQDICEPLLAIADVAREAWPQGVRGALIKLCQQNRDVVSTGKQLLADIKYVFDEEGEDKLTTRSIIVELLEIEGSPWAFMFEDAVKFERMKSAASKLAKLLRPYKIEPRTIKLDGGSTAKGYHRADFEEAWRRHLSIPGTDEVTISNVTDAENVTENTRESYEVTTVTSFSDTTENEPATAPKKWGAHNLLTDLLARIDTEARAGLHPKGDPDCAWGAHYPAEYRAAKGYVIRGQRDEQRAFELLARLARKVEANARRGAPLKQANGRESAEGSYPAAFVAARDYIRKQVERETESAGRIVYPGDWLMHSPANPLPAWADINPNAQCELCGEDVDRCEHWFIQSTDPSRARCAECQSVIWQVEGWEVSWPGGIALPVLTEDSRADYFRKPDLKQDAQRLVASVVEVLGEAYVPNRAKELAGV